MKRLIVAASLLLPTTALAQSAPPAPLPALPAPVDTAEVSPTTALGLSIGVTLAGFALGGIGASLDDNDAPAEVSAGLIVAGAAAAALGPSVGHWYAGDLWSRGLATRLVGATAALGGFALLIDASLCEDCAADHGDLGAVVFGLGVTAIVVGTIDDIVTAPGAARRHNAAGRRVTVTPTLSPRQAGLAVAGTF